MLLRLEERTPPYYIEESRDFQLFLRLYDCLNNMIMLDAAEVSHITDTRNIKTELLPLLQTKIGFFTNYSIDSEMLRAILYAFPLIVRNKGTIEGIRQAVRVFLKVLNIRSEIDIFYTEAGVSIGNIEASDHSILIGIGEAVDQFYILEEIFRYILPAGFAYTYYFYQGLDKVVNAQDKQEVYHLTIGQDINSSIRYKIIPESLPIFDENASYMANTLIRKEAGGSIIYRSTQPINPGDCSFANWGEYWESFDPDQDANYNYGETIRNILINSADTILIYDSRADDIGTHGTEFSDILGGLDG